LGDEIKGRLNSGRVLSDGSSLAAKVSYKPVEELVVEQGQVTEPYTI